MSAQSRPDSIRNNSKIQAGNFRDISAIGSSYQNWSELSFVRIRTPWPDIPDNDNWLCAQNNFVNDEIPCDNKNSFVGLARDF
jgi:hypothetical protein